MSKWVIDRDVRSMKKDKRLHKALFDSLKEAMLLWFVVVAQQDHLSQPSKHILV